MASSGGICLEEDVCLSELLVDIAINLSMVGLQHKVDLALVSLLLGLLDLGHLVTQVGNKHIFHGKVLASNIFGVLETDQEEVDVLGRQMLFQGFNATWEVKKKRSSEKKKKEEEEEKRKEE